MKSIQILLISLIILLSPAVVRCQNWMMAQHYMSLTIDTLIKKDWPNTGRLSGFNISYIEFDDLIEEYTIRFTDTVSCSKLDQPSVSGRATDIVVESGELTVSLFGGLATYKNEVGEITEVILPDLSEVVYIFNETGKDISFSLSKDDMKFDSYSLRAKEFYFWPCYDAENAFIKIVTLLEGKETGYVHYKLEKAMGYKVKYDPASSKFEIYPDKRMDVADFKKD